MKNNGKIIIVLPDLRGGGAERLHVNLANDWVARGFNVEFILMRKQGELLPLLSSNISVIDLGVERVRDVIFPLLNYVKRSHSDIIISAMWPMTSVAVLVWLLSGKQGKLFLSDHNQLSISCIKELNISPLLFKIVMRFTYPFASGIIAVSQGVKDDLRYLGGFSDKQVRVIYNPAATGVQVYQESLDVRVRLWGVGYKYCILSVGSLIKQKDHAALIRSFALLPQELNAKLIILGEGPLRQKLEELISWLGLHERVSMPGFVTDPYPWFRSADLFVLSSQWEGFGNVIVEALECGVPVVSTDCPSGPSEILDNGIYGRLVPVGNDIELAAAMTQSLSEKHDRELLITRAKDYSVSNISDQYLAYFFPLENHYDS
jgi:glycosyltransferase involved in cell wall biosynthesis